jgi:hypothetical protein
MSLSHPLPQEHPWRLEDCPLTLIAAWWEDALLAESADAGPLLEAWHLIPQPRAAS